MKEIKERTDRAGCDPNKAQRYEQLLAFVKRFAILDRVLEDADEIWRKAKTVQDGIDYSDQYTAKAARELLKEIGED